MKEVTFCLAVLLAVGLLVAKAGQKCKLPSVTGYILAGVLLGSSGLNIISWENLGGQLEVAPTNTHSRDSLLMAVLRQDSRVEDSRV